MDCEKFEATLLDELYGELDELTSAASKRHMGGCARCAALMAGLKATRKVATLPELEPTLDFEDRILAAVRAAEVKPTIGFAEIISMAGRWAMRPQNAMAAVFMLMVGTMSVLLSRGTRVSTAVGSASTAFSGSSYTVTENGSPAAAPLPTIASNDDYRLDPRAAAAAHGTPPLPPPSPPAASAAAAPEPLALKSMGTGSIAGDNGPEGALGGAADSRFAESKPKAVMHAAPSGPRNGYGGLGALGGGGGGAPSERARESQDLAQNAQNAGASQQQFAPPPPAAAPRPDDAFGNAKKRYKDGDYPGAAQAFDALASQGDTTSALWAARSVRDGAGGCSAAAPKFDAVAQASWGTADGYDATLEGADCYRRLGQSATAQSRYDRLLTVPAYASRAQAGINGMSQVAAKARASVARPTAAAAPASPPAAQPPPATAAPAAPAHP